MYSLTHYGLAVDKAKTACTIPVVGTKIEIYGSYLKTSHQI